MTHLPEYWKGACQAAERHLSRRVGAFQSADWALVKWLTGTDEVDQSSLLGVWDSSIHTFIPASLPLSAWLTTGHPL